ncbi:amyloid fiber anchoring/assembly protein TapA [Bacillus sp. HMF5848]|uniref:amyloid fiber anchoring/assembly protein TapA n=1 Tax=Bacillus sp. HMF5848 TaxID=2495421 RepID=UPI000F76AB05|nr:amyloid fiber anchoring/assembly protein TapA [Bacillus sp. HMF5848]RSK26410.1 amyloid fiber anchoring/assembly protein TapA [Bacillus sp. HMF5848]
MRKKRKSHSKNKGYKIILQVVVINYSLYITGTHISDTGALFNDVETIHNKIQVGTWETIKDFWDKSSLEFCDVGIEQLENGTFIIWATIKNGKDSEQMTNSVPFEVYMNEEGNPKFGDKVHDGEIPPLAPGQEYKIEFTPQESGKYKFKAYQAIGHPGNNSSDDKENRGNSGNQNKDNKKQANTMLAFSSFSLDSSEVDDNNLERQELWSEEITVDISATEAVYEEVYTDQSNQAFAIELSDLPIVNEQPGDDEALDDGSTEGEQKDNPAEDEPVDEGTTEEEETEAAPTDGETAEEGTEDELAAGEPVDEGTTEEEETADEPAAGEPVDEGTTEEEETADEPATGEPVDEGATEEEETEDEPAAGEPVDEGTTEEEETADESVAGEPVDEGTTEEEETEDESAAGEPVDEGTTEEEETVDEPAAGEPVDEGTTEEEETAEVPAAGEPVEQGTENSPTDNNPSSASNELVREDNDSSGDSENDDGEKNDNEGNKTEPIGDENKDGNADESVVLNSRYSKETNSIEKTIDYYTFFKQVMISEE